MATATERRKHARTDRCDLRQRHNDKERHGELRRRASQICGAQTARHLAALRFRNRSTPDGLSQNARDSQTERRRRLVTKARSPEIFYGKAKGLSTACVQSQLEGWSNDEYTAVMRERLAGEARCKEKKTSLQKIDWCASPGLEVAGRWPKAASCHIRVQAPSVWKSKVEW